MSLESNKYIERVINFFKYDNWGPEYLNFRIELEVKIHQRQGWELIDNPYPNIRRRHLRINHNNFNVKEFDSRDGKLLYIGNEINGKKEGIHISYEINGDIKESFEYKDGIEENEGYEFGKCGHVIIHRFKNGEFHGVCQSFKNHGDDYKRNYINGVLNGKNTRYWNNGNIRDELTYKDGKIVDCDYIEYHPEGEKSIVGQYKNGKKEGEWKSYYQDDKILSEDNYIRDLKDGICITFHKNGQLKEKSNYIRGLKDGICNTFHNNGELETKYDYNRGRIKDGIYEEFHPNGEIRIKGTYLNGEKEGPFTYYGPNGDIHVVENFHIGQIKK